jgi:hypothetical protein
MFAGQTVTYLPCVSNGVEEEENFFDHLSSLLGYGTECEVHPENLCLVHIIYLGILKRGPG